MFKTGSKIGFERGAKSNDMAIRQSTSTIFKADG